MAIMSILLILLLLFLEFHKTILINFFILVCIMSNLQVDFFGKLFKIPFEYKFNFKCMSPVNCYSCNSIGCLMSNKYRPVRFWRCYQKKFENI